VGTDKLDEQAWVCRARLIPREDEMWFRSFQIVSNIRSMSNPSIAPLHPRAARPRRVASCRFCIALLSTQCMCMCMCQNRLRYQPASSPTARDLEGAQQKATRGLRSHKCPRTRTTPASATAAVTTASTTSSRPSSTLVDRPLRSHDDGGLLAKVVLPAALKEPTYRSCE
jgi:hypothetical protein